MRYQRSKVWLLVIGIALTPACASKKKESAPAAARELSQKEKLGKLLFNDRNLSTPPGQACADCHAPETGFSNPNSSLPVSQGVHKDRFGNRNDLPAAYAAFSPEFRHNKEEGLYVGGQFWDGRAATLQEQAKGPFLNPLEMANPSSEAVIQKIRDAAYAGLFREVFGADALEDAGKAYDLAAEAIAAFERSHELNLFNSKYDLYLAGQTDLTEDERRGLSLFENEKKGNCAACHPSRPGPYSENPLFTDYPYDNLGVPKNAENPFYYLPQALNPDGTAFVDEGLGRVVRKPETRGKFKVPSLRNVAISSPYMHNGVFKNLHQVLAFYNTRDIGPWPAPEVAANVNREELGNLGLSEQEIGDIVVFLHTLTDNYLVTGKDRFRKE
jgi:cytochrome c peroxidase